MINVPRVFHLCSVVGLGVWITFSTALAQDSHPMTFTGYQPPLPAIFGNAWTIFGDGVIDSSTTGRLQSFLKEHDVPYSSSLNLNSPGGNLAQGMKLGRLIRDSELFTYVARRGGKHFDIESGECYSACAIAFLGGLYRFSHEGSSYGVHRFYSSGVGTIDSDSAQIISAALVEYIQEMGVSPSLFTFMTEAAPDQIKLLSEQEQIRLNVVNNGQGPTVWSIESHDGFMYLRGARNTWRGVNKFIMACSTEGVVLQVFYNAERRGAEITHFPIHWLIIDGEYSNPTIIPIGKYLVGGTQLGSNDVIGAAYLLPERAIEAIVHAHSVGIAMKPTEGAKIFMGFYAMNFADRGADKLVGLLHSCRYSK